MKETTHFGFQEVPVEEKTYRVREVFNSVARRYDLMNDLMSAGLHRLWKRVAIETIAIRPGTKSSIWHRAPVISLARCPIGQVQTVTWFWLISMTKCSELAVIAVSTMVN